MNDHETLAVPPAPRAADRLARVGKMATQAFELLGLAMAGSLSTYALERRQADTVAEFAEPPVT